MKAKQALRGLLGKPRTVEDIQAHIAQVKADRDALIVRQSEIVREMALSWGNDSEQDAQAAQHAGLQPRIEAANQALGLLEKELTEQAFKQSVQVFSDYLDTTLIFEGEVAKALKAADDAKQKAEELRQAYMNMFHQLNARQQNIGLLRPPLDWLASIGVALTPDHNSYFGRMQQAFTRRHNGDTSWRVNGESAQK